MNSNNAKKTSKNKVLKRKQEIKVIVVNPPTPEQAKAKIKEISEHINNMYSR